MNNLPKSHHEKRFPGCSNEPPWWPTSKRVTYRLVKQNAPAPRGPDSPILSATCGKGTFAYWSVVLQTWIIVLP